MPLVSKAACQSPGFPRRKDLRADSTSGAHSPRKKVLLSDGTEAEAHFLLVGKGTPSCLQRSSAAQWLKCLSSAWETPGIKSPLGQERHWATLAQPLPLPLTYLSGLLLWVLNEEGENQRGPLDLGCFVNAMNKTNKANK